MASTPEFLATPRDEDVSISTANTARDGTGTMGTIMTGAATGTLVTRIMVVAGGTTTAGVVRLFASTDGGSTKMLVEEMLVTAVTPSTSIPVWSGRFRTATLQQPMILADTNAIIYASTHNAETFYVHAEGGDL